MPRKLLKRPAPARVNPQAKSQAKPKGKGELKAQQAPETVQDIALSQEQSFELVKIGVSAAVSQFVFCRFVEICPGRSCYTTHLEPRDFFPSNCYKTRIFDASDPGLTYETFINGTNVPKNMNFNEAGDEIISFNSIVRGTGHPGVEKLLDWLEFGVANAVNDKCLARFQLSVYRKEVVPEQLVEALTINFTYKDTTENTSHVQVSVSASMSDKAGKVINLGHAQSGLRDLIAQVMNASMRFGGESTGRKVSMQLLYNENARPKNEYRGFRAASTSQILPEDCGLSMGRMNNGLHGLAVKYYSAPATHARLLSRKASNVIARGLNPTTPKAVIHDKRQFSSRQNQASQSDGTQRSTMQWLNDIGHSRGLTDIDTQLITNNSSQQASFEKNTMFPEPEEVDKEIEEKLVEENAVRCECMNHDDRENLIKCCDCGNYFHSQCYGYSRGTVGANFECYDCLLADSEPSILFEKIYPLCIRRRMIYYIEQHGFNDMEGLCQYMSLNQKDIQNLVDSLQTEGIIKNCSKLSQEPFRFVNLDKLRNDLFDPSKHIAHTKLFAAPGIDLHGVSQNPTQLTPVARRLRQPHDGSLRGARTEGSSTQTPSSWRSLHNETLRRSPRVAAHSTPQQPRKRVIDEIPSNASKKQRNAFAATSPFSLRSNSSH
ncbi:hypothetical protein DSL72_009150 [Monilinia vaccinii-corymbosi]|uniref:HORMA domain-containing protein n=1 Tax=Monilinia vaccinii-corymbosi TaxID=61207 RepID=A0A8A3PNR1_9HELO|nr:hypothetical protein DSL72_009150 [Monilinia vaccinii-corymbosi]